MDLDGKKVDLRLRTQDLAEDDLVDLGLKTQDLEKDLKVLKMDLKQDLGDNYGDKFRKISACGAINELERYTRIEIIRLVSTKCGNCVF